MRVLVTGAAGFIGWHLCHRLLNLGHEVTSLDRVDHAGWPSDRFRHVRGDVLDHAAVAPLVHNQDVIFHLASVAGVDAVVKNPILTMDVAFNGALNVLLAAERHTRVIVFSTSEVAGTMALDASEHTPAQLGPAVEGRWVYAAAKAATEHLALAFHRQHGLEALAIRPFNIYGPRQIGQGAVHTFVRRAIANEDLVLNGNGSRIRSWCYVEDFVEGCVAAMTKKEAVGKVINLGDPNTAISVRTLAEEIVTLAESKSQIVVGPDLGPDVEQRSPNIALARNVLGWSPTTSLRDGLRATLAWYRGL